MLDYEQAGVSIKNADALTEIIKKDIKSENIGMFAGLYEHPVLPEHYLVACTDGVGTKVMSLLEADKIETAAIDLIAMNLNDMICTGAQPMFFLDYFATSKLDVKVTSRFIKALKNELSKYNCALLGGETAELGDLVKEGHFDVGGFAVGIVKKDKILSQSNVKKNDLIIGLKSSGPHSNGYTLIRKLYEKGLLTQEEMTYSLEPTYIYVKEILDLCEKELIKVCANITGGGIIDNLKRVIPDNLSPEINIDKIPAQPIFNRLEHLCGAEEAYKTFNMGVGMCIIASKEKSDKVMDICEKFNPFILGEIKELK